MKVRSDKNNQNEEDMGQTSRSVSSVVGPCLTGASLRPSATATTTKPSSATKTMASESVF